MPSKRRWTKGKLGKALAACADEGEYHAPKRNDPGGSHVVIMSKGGTVFKLFICEMVNPLTGSSEARVPPVSKK